MERLIYTVEVLQRNTGWYSESWWGAQLSCWKHLKAQMDTAKQMWMLPDPHLREEHFRHFWSIATCSWNRALLEGQQLPCAVPSVGQLWQWLWCAPGIPSCAVRWAVQRWGAMQGQPGCRSWSCQHRDEWQGSTPVCSQGIELAGLRLEAPSCSVWPHG